MSVEDTFYPQEVLSAININPEKKSVFDDCLSPPDNAIARYQQVYPSLSVERISHVLVDHALLLANATIGFDYIPMFLDKALRAAETAQ